MSLNLIYFEVSEDLIIIIIFFKFNGSRYKKFQILLLVFSQHVYKYI